VLRSTVAARHILVHEQPRERPYPERDIPEFFSHSAQFVAALEWLRSRHFRVYILRGEALASTHEVNPAKPVSDAIIKLHNRTVANVTAGLNMALTPASRDDEQLLLDSGVMNTGLSERVMLSGAADAIWRAE